MGSKNQDERRIAKFRCSLEVLRQILVLDPLIMNAKWSNVPSDIEILGIDQSFLNTLNNEFFVYFASSQNETVLDGNDIPEVAPFEFSDVPRETD